MRSTTRAALGVAAASLAAPLLAVAMPATASAQQPAIVQPAHGLIAGGYLTTFDLTQPGYYTPIVTITGVPAGSTVVGIDERPKTGALYAVVRLANGTGSVYTLNPTTGAATLVAALRNATTLAPIVLTGARFGVDFNPAADALRIVGDDGQNLRALPSDRVVATVPRFTGDTFVDGTLSYSPIGSMPRPAATGIHASAYTQNLPVTAATMLINIDTTLDDLTTQAPPNDGTQVKRADVGTSGRPVQGFDIATTGTTDAGFVALGFTEVVPPANIIVDLLQRLKLAPRPTRTRTEIVAVDLTTGAFSSRGSLGLLNLVDIAVDTPAPPAG